MFLAALDVLESSQVIELYSWSRQRERGVSIMLAELGLFAHAKRWHDALRPRKGHDAP